MKPLSARSARFDPMRDAVLFESGAIEVAVTRSALADWFGKPVPEAAAVHRALSIEATLRRAANAVDPDDGVITITPRLLANVRETLDAD